jgi:hypothetical protein
MSRIRPSTTAALANGLHVVRARSWSIVVGLALPIGVAHLPQDRQGLPMVVGGLLEVALAEHAEGEHAEGLAFTPAVTHSRNMARA